MNKQSAAVLVSTTRHPLSGLPCPSRNDTLALEIGRRISNATMRVLHAGDPTDPALGDYLALGAPIVEVAPTAAGDEVVPALARLLQETSLVLCGSRTENGLGSGMLPYALAAALNRPVVTNALEMDLDNDIAQVVQYLPKGQRRRLEVPLPAVIAVHSRAAAEPRYIYARRLAGRIETLPAWTERRDHRRNTVAWTIDALERAPVKFRAIDRRSGHSRMLSATGATQRSGEVLTEGSSTAKASALLAYLRQHQLIDV